MKTVAASPSSGPAAQAAAILAALAVAALVIASAIAGAAAYRDPALALRFEPGDPAALTRAARLALQAGRDAPAEALARQAIAGDPLSAEAMGIAGLAADRLGEGGLARRRFALAAALSRRDRITEAWLVQRALASGDPAAAATSLDALLRTQTDPPLIEAALAEMIAIAGAPGGREAVAQRLALNPPWRAGFFGRLNATPQDSAIEEPLLITLARRGAAPVAAEYGPFIAALAQRGDLTRALADYDDIRGANPALLLRDGNFGHPPDGTPFTWSAAGGPGATASFAAPSGGLRIVWDGFSTPQLPGQLLLLAPGNYRLQWREQGEGDGGPGREAAGEAGATLSWTLTCAGAAVPVAAAADTAGRSWSDAALAFTVPTGCAAVWLRLQPRPAERPEDIVRRYAAMRLLRLGWIPEPDARAPAARTPQAQAKRTDRVSVRRG